MQKHRGRWACALGAVVWVLSAIPAHAQAPRRAPAPAAPAVAAAPGPAAAVTAAPPPTVASNLFPLSAKDQAALDRVLAQWQERASSVRTFKCAMRRWEFNNVFKTTTFTEGELRYRRPSEALYRVRRPNETEWLDYWVCDGNSIFEFNAPQKTLVERPLPTEMQGQAIEDGPLPFVFSSSAAKLKERYQMRLIAPPADRVDEIWLEAFPTRREDAANFIRAEMILDAKEMLPTAVRIHLPNGQDYTVHQFMDIVVNDPLGFLKGDFAAPKAPHGWQRRVEQIEPLAAQPPRASTAPRQATAPTRPAR